MTKHSDKALATIAAMGTVPTDWHLTEIEWVEEVRIVPGDVRCPDCAGGRWVRRDDAGAVIPAPGDGRNFDYENQARREAYARGERNHYGNCRTCRGTRGRMRGLSTGKVRGMVERRVMVGYPKFPKAARFDSRFNTGAYCCQLCAKTIEKSGRVPVNTDGAEPHAMWVGEDCARKFLGVKIKRDADSVMEDAK